MVPVGVERNGRFERAKKPSIISFISKMIQDRAVVTMECEYKTVPKLSDNIINNDLERHKPDLRSHHSLTPSVQSVEGLNENNYNKKYVLSNSKSVQCNFFVFNYVTFSSKSVAVYKISWWLDDFTLRYGDITIFKMAAVCHLEIVLPPYETTHEVSVDGCSCLSIWCTDLKI